MEKLKVILIAVLIWAAIIWFARTMKQKSDERLKKIEERMPEMEPVTEKETRFLVIYAIYLFLEGLLMVVIFCAGHGLEKESNMKPVY